MPKILRALTLLVLGFAALLPRLATAASAPAVTPALATPLEGALPNGLRYFILPHRTEPGRASLHLLVRAGSLDERADELGYAHFVEHMAFNGTRHYPPGELVKFFQKTGLAWGPDANANTSFTSTNYRLDLPAGQAVHLPEALQVLRDFADGIDFIPAEVRREKGVVLSELRERATHHYQLEVQAMAALHRGTPVPGRLPIGDATQISRATAASLRAYYQRCYQPQRMTLVAVGDFDPAVVLAQIETHFASLPAATAPSLPVEPGTPPADGLHTRVIVNHLGTAAIATLAAIGARLPDTPADRELDCAQQLVTRALNRRQRDLRAQSPDRFGLIQAVRVPDLDGRFALHTLEAHTAAGDWAAGVREIERELRRARTHGFTPAELAEAAAALLADLQNFRDTLQGAPPNIIAQQATTAFVAGLPWRDPAEILATATAYVPRCTPAEAVAALHTMFPEDRLCLMLNTRQPPVRGSAELRDAFDASADQPLAEEAPADDAPLKFRYTDFGPAGAIAAQRHEADLGLDLVTFANGARLNLRASPTEPHRFRLAARVGRGLPDLPRDQPGLFSLASMLLGRCDFGRQTREELGRLIRVRGVTARVTNTGNQLLVTLEGPAAELPFAFQFLTAFLSDVKLEPARLTQALSDYAGFFNPLMGSIDGFARAEFRYQMHSSDPRVAATATAQVAGYPFDSLATWIRAHWLNGQLEIGLAGDFDPAAAIAAAAATVGTLPTRHEPPITADERITLPAKPRREIIYRPASPEKATVVYFGWPAPLTGTREYRALRFATDALIDRLRLQLREQRGATYAPGGGVDRALWQPDFGYAWLRLSFDPAQSRKLAELVNRLADELARRGLTEEEFARLAAPLRAQAAEDLRANVWWLQQVLLYAQTQPGVLADARSHLRDFTDLTRPEVNRAAAAHLRLANSNGIGAAPATARR